MTKNRIEKAVEVIRYAIDNQISVKEASKKSGYADTYVKNVKAIVYEKYDNGTLDDELFNMFDDVYGVYLKSHKESNVNRQTTKINKEKTTINFKNSENAEIEWKGGKNYKDGHIKTLDQLLKVTQVDLDIWKVKSYTVNKWDVTSWKSNSPETIENFQVKAQLERDIKTQRAKDAAVIYNELTKKYKPTILNVNAVNLNSDENNLLEISIFDLHIGKLAWAGETGENYDVKIAKKRFKTSIEKLLQRASGFNYSRILFPIGNDFFNSDNIFNTTTKGTQQDEDLRWQKTFKVGTELLVDGINMLKQSGVPVDVIVIPGNHDFERSFYMGTVLEGWFRNDEMVDINNGASPRKYYRFGEVLLGFTHGGEEKESSLPLIMASDIESKPMWSETKFHEWHLGHIHRKRNVKYSVVEKKQSLAEDLGVTIRYLSSLTGTEEWHHRKGFIGHIKAADAFIWNDNTGLLVHLNSNYVE